MTASGAIFHAWPYLHKESVISGGESHSNLGKTDVSAWREKICLHRELHSSRFPGSGVLKTRGIRNVQRMASQGQVTKLCYTSEKRSNTSFTQ